MDITKGTISIDDIDILTEMSASTKAKVNIASVKGTTQFVVYKELDDRGNISLYERIMDMQQQEKKTCFPRIYGVWAKNGKIILIEEYISGGTLEENIQKGVKFSEDELTDYMIQLCSALRRIHKLNPPIIHRDLKPGNIIITGNGELRVLDFDSSREYDKSVSHDTVNLGTKGYAPPEQYGFTQTDVRSDIYSFGKIFGELLDNTNAFGSYIQRCRRIIDKATMFDPDKRYTDTDILLKELHALKRPMTDKRKVLLSILAMVFVIFGVTFGFVMNRDWKNNVTSEDTHLHSNIETTPQETSGHATEVLVNRQTEAESPTTEKKQTTTESQTSTKQQADMRFMLSYGNGMTEYYEDYEGVYNHICELNNPEYEYTITYISDTQAGFNGIYSIMALPPVAGKLIFTVENESGIDNCKLLMNDVTATYPIVSYMNMFLDGCSFADLTMDSRIGGYISLSGENTLNNVTLRNRAFLVTGQGGAVTIKKLVMEDEISFLCFSEGIFYIKELVGYNGKVRMHINPGYDSYERQLIITDSDVSVEQFYVKNSISEEYTLGLEKNESGQKVLSLVKRETADIGTADIGMEQTSQIMRYELSYGTGISEYYENYEGVYNRMCELNNPEYEYIITYIHDSVIKNVNDYKITVLPPVAGKITFSVGENVGVKGCVLRLNNLIASYPVVTFSHVMITDCSFDDFTVDGLFNVSATLHGENSFGNVTLSNGGYFVVMDGGSATVSRLEMADKKASLGFSEGTFNIKELVGYNGIIKMYINRGYDNYERQLIATETDILVEQFSVHYNTSEEFTFAIDKNEHGQNVLSLVPRE